MGATDHPHARGDSGMAKFAGAAVGGSPPRAWGLCKPAQAFGKLRRFTPTRGLRMYPKLHEESCARGLRFAFGRR